MPWTAPSQCAGSLLPLRRAHTSPHPAACEPSRAPAGQPQLTQSAAVQRLPRQLPLQVGAEEQDRALVPRLPQLPRNMGQLGKVEKVGKGAGSRAPSLPYSKEDQVTGYCPPDQGTAGGQGEGGRGRRESQSGERVAPRMGKKELTRQRQAPTQPALPPPPHPPRAGHSPGEV